MLQLERRKDMEIENEMRKFEEELGKFHIPRYEDLPDIELYMDQVVALLNKNLYIIANNDNVITPSMVNNYVKFGLIPAPVGKRYTRKHLCYMTALCFLKQILSMNEIKLLVTHQLKYSTELDLYNLFCTELEKFFKNCSSFDPHQPTLCDEKVHCLIYCAKAIAYKLHAQKYIQIINTASEFEKKVDKKNIDKKNTDKNKDAKKETTTKK